MSSTSDSDQPRSRVAPRETLQAFHRLLGMYIIRGTYAEACALVIGLDEGVPNPFLRGFRAWLVDRNGERPELAFPDLVLREAGVTDKGSRSELTESENDACIQVLFDLLDSYLSGAAA